MARQVLTPIRGSAGGTATAPVTADKANGSIIANWDPRMIITIANPGGSGALSVTITMFATCDVCGQQTNTVVSIPAATTEELSGYRKDLFGEADGSLWLDYAGGGTATISVELP